MLGKTLLHYRVEEKSGAGRMEVVYRATDTKLGRDVAIKVLPDSFAQRRARFEGVARQRRQRYRLPLKEDRCVRS